MAAISDPAKHLSHPFFLCWETIRPEMMRFFEMQQLRQGTGPGKSPSPFGIILIITPSMLYKRLRSPSLSLHHLRKVQHFTGAIKENDRKIAKKLTSWLPNNLLRACRGRWKSAGLHIVSLISCQQADYSGNGCWTWYKHAWSAACL